MVRSGRSISLDSKLWVRIEEFAKENGFEDISSAIEFLIKKALGEKK
jgi:metal-responsive CopG/Arc/MetJ family transcriptional regulator